jgi:hypothetical protein
MKSAITGALFRAVCQKCYRKLASLLSIEGGPNRNSTSGQSFPTREELVAVEGTLERLRSDIAKSQKRKDGWDKKS